MTKEHRFIARKRLVDAVKASPRNQAAREALAAFYEAQVLTAQADEQRRKARQCERFDPDYDYAAKLGKYGLIVQLHADGELVSLHDGPLRYWACPAALQAYLDSVPEKDWHARDMPIDEVAIPLEVLQQLAENKEGVWKYCYPFPGQEWELKEFHDGSWVESKKGQEPVFYTAEMAKKLSLKKAVVALTGRRMEEFS